MFALLNPHLERSEVFEIQCRLKLELICAAAQSQKIYDVNEQPTVFVYEKRLYWAVLHGRVLQYAKLHGQTALVLGSVSIENGQSSHYPHDAALVART